MNALLRLGFRPFFLGAAMFSCASMTLWLWRYMWAEHAAATGGLNAQVWHAHEMIFGYALAVIAGFLLTAVQNWTGVRTLQGRPLAALVLLWLGARLALLAAHDLSLLLGMALDGVFGIGLIVSLAHPIIRSKQWKQAGVLVVTLLIVTADMLFYWGAITDSMRELYRGMYLGLYLVTALIIIIAGRVIPFFAERALGPALALHRWPWLERANLALFAVFITVEVFTPYQSLVCYLSAALFVSNTVRLWGWYCAGIWSKPLLWVLYVAYGFITLGFAYKCLAAWIPLMPYLSVHAIAYGGIGMMTLGMMSRVSLGHTGRDVQHPPPSLFWAFATLAAGASVRVVLPLFDSAHYQWWVALSQVAWIGAFSLFVWVYFPILTAPRIDGRDG